MARFVKPVEINLLAYDGTVNGLGDFWLKMVEFWDHTSCFPKLRALAIA